MNRKNIVLITIDCLRADHIKHMKKLMNRKEKIVFTNMFSNATYTGLSVPSMLTSSIPPLIKQKTTIAEIIKEYDYNTAAFVPNALLLDNRYRKLKIDKGFNFYKNYIREDVSGNTLRAVDKLATGLRDVIIILSKFIPKNVLKSLQKASGFMPFTVWVPYPRSDQVLNDAKKWLMKNSKPFFLWIHLMDVHGPYIPPDKYNSVDKKITLTVNKRLRYSKNWLPKEDVKILHKLYIDNIRYVDDSINNFLDEIIDKDTVVLITSDHGEQFLEHGGIGHINSNMYDEQLHIPLIILNIGNKIIDNLVSLIDIAPTIMYLTGIDTPGFIGKNMLNINKEKPIFFAGYNKNWNVLFGLRTKEFKLFRGTNGWEMYNLLDDVNEMHNIYNEKQDILKLLKIELLKILEEKNRIENENNKLKNISKHLKKVKN